MSVIDFTKTIFKNKIIRSKPYKSNLILGLSICVAIVYAVSSSLPGELIKNVTKSFDYGIYTSKIDGITNNMGCATIVGKAEPSGLACMQNLYNKCSDIRMYTFVTNFLLFLTVILLIFNKNESKTRYKICIISIFSTLILNILNTFMVFSMKNNSVNDKNCGLKDMDKTDLEFGVSHYLNLGALGGILLINLLMLYKYKKILF